MPRLQVKNSSNVFVIIYPETVPEQIIGSTALGRKLLASNGQGFLRVQANNEVDYINGQTMLTAIGAAPYTHPHSPDQVTGLATALSNKADLDAPIASGGKILISQIPASVLAGLKFSGALPEKVHFGLGAPADGYTNWNLINQPQDFGKYWICNHAECFIRSTTSYKWENRDDGEAGTVLAADFKLERGDWVVYKTNTANIFVMGIANNTYPLAAINDYGVVKLSDPNSLAFRHNLSDVSSGNRVLDEAALRKVLKDIIYSTSEPTLALPGDIWIDTSAPV